MTPAPTQASVRLVPVRPLRAGMLAYIAALAAIEMIAGMVVALAWKDQSSFAVVSPAEMNKLAEMFNRLRLIEGVVVAGAVVTTLFWSFTVVRNASTACRNGRSGAAAVISWALVPVLVLVLAQNRAEHAPAAVSSGVLLAQAAVMYLPFGTIAVASQRVGGRTMPFVRWYVALTLVFLVHEMFTGSFNLAEPKPSHDLGRAAALMVASALVLGLMVIMAGEASKSMEDATDERMAQHRSWRDDALDRFKKVVRAERESPRTIPPPPIGARQPVLVGAASAPVMAATAMAAQAMMPQSMMPQAMMPQVAAPPPVVPVAQPVAQPVVQPVAQPVVQPEPIAQPAGVQAFGMAPLAVRTFPATPTVEPSPAPVAPAPVAQVAPAAPAAVDVVAEPEAPAPAPAPTNSMFAPLAPRTAPRSL